MYFAFQSRSDKTDYEIRKKIKKTKKKQKTESTDNETVIAITEKSLGDDGRIEAK